MTATWSISSRPTPKARTPSSSRPSAARSKAAPAPPRQCGSTGAPHPSPLRRRKKGPSSSPPEERGGVTRRVSVCRHVQRLQSPGDREAVTLGREDDHLALVGVEARQRRDVDLMGDEDEGAAAVAGHQLTHGARLLGLTAAVAEDGIELRPDLDRAEGQTRRVDAAAPGARANAVYGDAPRLEGRADALRVLTARGREVALRAAVVEAGPGGIGQALIRGGVAHDDDLAARLEESPQRLTRPGLDGQRQECQGEDDAGEPHHAGMGRTSTRDS